MANPARSLSSPPLRSVIASSWALFLGIGLMMAGNGLSVTLVGIRSTLEDFDTLAIGVLTAGYYAGFLMGSWLALAALRRVDTLGSSPLLLRRRQWLR